MLVPVIRMIVLPLLALVKSKHRLIAIAMKEDIEVRLKRKKKKIKTK